MNLNINTLIYLQWLVHILTNQIQSAKVAVGIHELPLSNAINVMGTHGLL